MRRSRRTRSTLTGAGVVLAASAVFGLVISCGDGVRLGGAYPDPDGGQAATTSNTDAAGASCSSNAECIAANSGEPFLCQSGQCVALKSPECPYVVEPGDVTNDSAIVVGAFVPLGGGLGLTHPITLAYQLALNELKAAGGLPESTGRPRRPLAVVFCDSSPDAIDRGVQHLARTVKVPALVPLFGRTDVLRLFQDELLPRGIFTLDPLEGDAAMKGFASNQLYWNLVGLPEDLAPAYRPLVSRVEASVRSRLGWSPADNVRLAVVTSDSPTEAAISNFVRGPNGISFNGQSASANGSNFLSLKVPSLDVNPSATFTDAYNTLRAFRPNIVVFLTAGEVNSFLPQLDKDLQTDGAPLPSYVLSARNSAAVLDYLAADTVEPSDTKLRRFVGVRRAGPLDKTEYLKYLQRYAEASPAENPASYRETAPFYDAVYWLAYGFFAAGPSAPVQGASFAAGVRKLLSGPLIHPGSVSDAFSTIASSTSVTYEGVMGTRSFDTASGMPESVGAAYCYAREAGNVQPRYDALRYDPATKDLVATDEPFCFSPF